MKRKKQPEQSNNFRKVWQRMQREKPDNSQCIEGEVLQMCKGRWGEGALAPGKRLSFRKT